MHLRYGMGCVPSNAPLWGAVLFIKTGYHIALINLSKQGRLRKGNNSQSECLLSVVSSGSFLRAALDWEGVSAITAS